MLEIRERPLIMGILNVTPDSFSDGGRYVDPQRAVDHGLAMLDQGADILDVGGESTRPGADAVPADEEAGRVVPVIERLRRCSAVPLSVDTMKAAVARAALDAGADIVNDVSALRHDPDMAGVVREAGAGAVLMHMQGMPRTMQAGPRYEDVVDEVAAMLQERLAACEAAGIARDALAVDPGIGFGKTVAHNLALLAGLDTLAASGRPVLVGLSRKSFLGSLTGREVNDRLPASLAALAFCVQQGAHVMRVHDVQESLEAVTVAATLVREAEKKA
jgi:dihydropteroate synthase